VNLDAFIALRSKPSQGFYSGKLHLKTRNFSGSGSQTSARQAAADRRHPNACGLLALEDEAKQAAKKVSACLVRG
jgi:hypothetical protein